jgi:hypothetical protein
MHSTGGNTLSTALAYYHMQSYLCLLEKNKAE